MEHSAGIIGKLKAGRGTRRAGRIPAFCALALFLFSVSGIGFVVHVLEESRTEGICCLFEEFARGGGTGAGGPEAASLGPLSAHSGHGHDSDACPICSQFMTTVAARWSHGRLLSAPVRLGAECPPPDAGRPAIPVHDTCRLRAPPSSFPA